MAESDGRSMAELNNNNEITNAQFDENSNCMKSNYNFMQSHQPFLGAIPLSTDILTKANIGLWAFELDEGSEPRMYVDDAMLKLIGLEHQISPEETYHAWYDYIDEGSYELVADAVEKMTNGEHAEVQYPWHHPNGEVWTVRCGGVRNFEYTKGIRIEGTHQNVTELLHFVQMAAEEKEKRHLHIIHQNMEIIGGLTSEYLALYYINFSEGVFKIYSVDENKLADTKKLLNKSDDPFSLIKMFAKSSAVHPEDRELFDGITREGVKRRLEGSKKFTIRFRRDYGSGYLWSVMDIVKYEAINEEANAIVIGFAERDKEIRQEMANLAARKNADIIDGIISGYSTAYVVNMEEDTFRILKNHDNSNKIFYTYHFSESINAYIETNVYPNDRKALLEKVDYKNLSEKLQGESSLKFEYRAKIDNVYRWHEMFITSVGEGGDILIAVAAHDNEILYQHIEGIMTDRFLGIYVVDFSGNDMKILKGTGGFKQYEGKVIPWRETMIQFSQNLLGDDKIFFRDVYGKPEIIREMLTKDKDIEYYYQSPNYGGELIWMKSEVHTLTLDENGLPETAMVGISLIDSQQSEKMKMNQTIAEQKELLENQQEQLKEALAMAQAASGAKSNFLFNMSHDIRTPMNAIIGYTAMARKYIEEEQRVRDYLEKIDISGKQLLSLINQVLEMSRIESGKIVLKDEPADIVEKARNMQTMSGSDVERKDLAFNLEIKNITHRNVFADVSRMNQILVNIIGNSIKYTPEGGKIDFIVEEVPCDKDGFGLYKFTISDTGIGMSEEFLKHIFDEFSRENTSTVSHIQGTGLGMSIVKKLVDLMNGEINIKSKQGEGTTTAITIPMKLDESAKISESENEEENSHAVQLKGVKVLLVEDNEMNLEIAMEILEECGVIVDTADDGTVAVEKMKNASPDTYDLILMDIQMPMMNGYDATRQIRLLTNGTQNIPIIAMTANAFDEDRKNAFEAGMNEHVAKPIDITKLKSAIAKFI